MKIINRIKRSKTVQRIEGAWYELDRPEKIYLTIVHLLAIAGAASLLQ